MRKSTEFLAKKFTEFLVEDIDSTISNIERATNKYNSEVLYTNINFVTEYRGLINQNRKKNEGHLLFNASHGISLLITGEIPVFKDQT